MLSGIVKGIGAGVGLVNEAIAHRKEKKGKEAQSTDLQSQEDASDSDLEDDEIAWRLDEAAEAADEQFHSKEKSKEAEGEEPPEYTVNELVDNFVAHHPALPPEYSLPIGKLAAPVVLPQKRPRTKGRGFVRAYAPMLAECGIDQSTFLEFLDGFDKSTHVRILHPSRPQSTYECINLDGTNPWVGKPIFESNKWRRNGRGHGPRAYHHGCNYQRTSRCRHSPRTPIPT